MSSESEPVTPELLRGWGLPDGGDSKYSRGQVFVLGGAARSPGAAMLAGTAALRVGAGRLTLAVARSVAAEVAVAVPECGVVPLSETDDNHVDGRAAASSSAVELVNADAVLIGPGLDDLEQTVALLDAVGDRAGANTTLVLDAFALGALSTRPRLRDRLPERLVMTPNQEEAALLLGREIGDLTANVAELAQRFAAAVSCYGCIAAPDGRVWQIGSGQSGLGTSGSGDVLSGASAGFSARGVPIERAAVWGSYVHSVAGDRLAVQVAPLGYLARELLGELPGVIVEVGRRS